MDIPDTTAHQVARHRRSRPLAAALAAVAVTGELVAGCGSNGSANGAATHRRATHSTPHASGLHARTTSIGTVLVDASGHTVYALDGDTTAHRACTGGCLAIWPPVTAGGSQVIVNGHRTYTYVLDRSAGQTNGQDLRDTWGHWRALDASGDPLTAGTTASKGAYNGGGYG